MKNKFAFVLTAILLSCSWPARAADFAYVEWSRAAGDDAQSWGYNAFDDKKSSAWCSGPDGVSDRLVVGFIGDQKVDEVGLIVGALNKKGQLDKSRARVRELRVSDGRTQQVLLFADKPGMQSIRINPALNSNRISFVVEKVYFGERRSSPVCISSIALRKNGQLVNGAKTGAKIRHIKSAQQKLLHLWVDSPGAPERYLTFALNGRFSWVFAPILDGKPAKIKGRWTRKGDKLFLSPDRGKHVSLKLSLGRVADGDQIFQQLLIEGKGPHEKFSATYQAGVQN